MSRGKFEKNVEYKIFIFIRKIHKLLVYLEGVNLSIALRAIFKAVSKHHYNQNNCQYSIRLAYYKNDLLLFCEITDTYLRFSNKSVNSLLRSNGKQDGGY